ncbi:hypothetical protein V8G54_027992 [Vigna mungo]|uniref:Uncharacterized protein n=1 Tax=Vigna mungo TaxID=3915 RepID=A0AAQ3MRR8_VIGMU
MWVLSITANVRTYYQQFEEQQTQSLIDQRIKEHLGQAAAFQQVGVAYNHLMVQRPNLPPVLPPPRLPIPGNAQVPGSQPLMPGMRPPDMFLHLPCLQCYPHLVLPRCRVNLVPYQGPLH